MTTRKMNNPKLLACLCWMACTAAVANAKASNRQTMGVNRDFVERFEYGRRQRTLQLSMITTSVPVMYPATGAPAPIPPGKGTPPLPPGKGNGPGKGSGPGKGGNPMPPPDKSKGDAPGKSKEKSSKSAKSAKSLHPAKGKGEGTSAPTKYFPPTAGKGKGTPKSAKSNVPTSVGKGGKGKGGGGKKGPPSKGDSPPPVSKGKGGSPSPKSSKSKKTNNPKSMPPSAPTAPSPPTANPPTPQPTPATGPTPLPTTASPTQPVPTASPTVNDLPTVVLNNFELLYTLDQQRFPTDTDYNEVANATDIYLAGYWNDSLTTIDGVSFLRSSTVMIDNDFSFGEPVAIFYQASVTFTSDSTVPSTADLNQLLQTAFTGANEPIYRDFFISEIDPTNLFVTTDNVTFQFSTAAAAESQAGIFGSSSSDQTLMFAAAGAIGGLAAFLLVLFGLNAYDRRREAVPTGEHFDLVAKKKTTVRDDATVAMTVASSMSRSSSKRTKSSGRYTSAPLRHSNAMPERAPPGANPMYPTLGDDDSATEEFEDEGLPPSKQKVVVDPAKERDDWLRSRGEYS